MPYLTVDFGGFVPDTFTRNPQYSDLLVRWFQYGTFLPVLRVHGCRNTPFWNYDNNTGKILTYYTMLRYRLMPYIYSMGAMVTFENFTIDRALIMDFDDDPKVYNIADQFMFGKEMLICPVTTHKAVSREVYLPKTAGQWTDFWTGEKYIPGTEIKANAPLNKVPVFVKAGSIIPMGPFMQFANEKKADTLEVRIYSGADGKFELYEDEGDNFNYMQGKCSRITFSWNDHKHVFTISDRKGDFSGMHKDMVINLILVSEHQGIGLNIGPKPDKVIQYRGLKINVKLKMI